MICLGASQILLTNRDVTHTLNPKRSRRAPTYLYTKGKKPILSTDYVPSSVPHLDTSRPITSTVASSPFFNQSDPPAIPRRSASPEWSTSSGSESSAGTMPTLAPPGSTDGTNDTSLSIDDIGNLHPIVSLRTVDSFPFLPIRRESGFEIHQDYPEFPREESIDIVGDPGSSGYSSLSEYSSFGSTEEEEEDDDDDMNGEADLGDIEHTRVRVDISDLGQEYEEFRDGFGIVDGNEDSINDDDDDDDDDVGQTDEDNDDDSFILAEAVWDPNLAVIPQERALTPGDQTEPGNDNAPVDTELFETPPRRVA
ncbi:hypothetical protein ABW20_dc0106687 [Dactylellina cionopaga]|nr:hypothetical protein ABW20_dc0106687 [Dactylellina cionopaga]